MLNRNLKLAHLNLPTAIDCCRPQSTAAVIHLETDTGHGTASMPNWCSALPGLSSVRGIGSRISSLFCFELFALGLCVFV